MSLVWLGSVLGGDIVLQAYHIPKPTKMAAALRILSNEEVTSTYLRSEEFGPLESALRGDIYLPDAQPYSSIFERSEIFLSTISDSRGATGSARRHLLRYR